MPDTLKNQRDINKLFPHYSFPKRTGLRNIFAYLCKIVYTNKYLK